MPTVTIPRPAPPSPPQQEQQQGKARSSMPNPGDVEIVDIRGASDEATVKKTMLEVLAGGQDGRPRKMPTMLLYDERGLQLFEAITHLDEYYLTNREINVLEKNAADMAAKIAPGTLLVELGSGNLRKIMILLDALERAGKDIEYFALDLSHDELQRTLTQLPAYRHVKSRGLWGTYDDGKRWMEREGVHERRKCVMHTGSTIGNFSRDDAAEFLRGFAKVMNDSDTLMIGVDGCQDGTNVYNAYNDNWGVSHEFIRNSLGHINATLGEAVFAPDDWRLTGEFVSDAAGSRHQYWMSPVREVAVMGTMIRPHERIVMEESWKYTRREARQLWDAAGLRQAAGWVDEREYGLYMIEKIKTPFSMDPAEYAAEALPSLDEWKTLWALWDRVTRGMLPQQALLSKPIDLRNACIFYLGHIPTFCDIQLTKTMAAASEAWGRLARPTEPSAYARIFERGIDPDVDNPDHCHAHSDIPDEWPGLDDILAYQARIRARVQAIYEEGHRNRDSSSVEAALGREVARGAWLAFEHEAMHLETLLFMLLQSDDTLPPPGVEAPDWETMARGARRARVANEWHRVPARVVGVGLAGDEEGSVVAGEDFGWDIEKPARKADVAAFEIKGAPITNEEYAAYMVANNITERPTSWTALSSSPGTAAADMPLHADGVLSLLAFARTTAVRTVFGPVPLKHALDWPVAASYDELAGCAAWMGGRIPTADEVRSAHAHAADERRRRDDAQGKLDRMVPAVNGHLLHDGVEVTPPTSPASPAGTDKRAAGREGPFVPLAGANVGFAHWHPVPVTAAGGAVGARAEMGGVWEWTSTVLARHEGYKPMALYPGYSADFFDEKHNVILGGSWATVPRIAGRTSFVNWFQRNYRYVWAGARVARDI